MNKKENISFLKRKLNSLYELIQDGIVMTDMEGNILECNQAYADMLGYTKDEVKKLTYQQLTPAKWHRMEEEIVRERIAKTGYADTYEKEYIRKDGTVFPISLRAWLMRGEDGRPWGMWGIVRDVTKERRAEEELKRHRDHLADLVERRTSDLEEVQKALRESEERYRTLFENSPDAIMVVDSDGRLAMVNRLALSISGYQKKEELVGREFLTLVAPQDRKRLTAYLDGLLKSGSGGGREIEFLGLKKDGRHFFAEGRASLAMDDKGNPAGIVISVRDITLRK